MFHKTHVSAPASLKMSNPAVAPRAPLSEVHRTLSEIPQSYFLPDLEGTFNKNKGQKDPAVLHAEMNANGELDMELAPSVNIPLRHTLNRALFNAAPHKQNGRANTGTATLRKRSHQGLMVVKAFHSKLPVVASRRADYALKPLVEARIRNVVAADGGTRNTIGRIAKAYPKKGSSVEFPPTISEVKKAIASSGLDLSAIPKELLRPLDLSAVGQEHAEITINTKADSGFPVDVKITEPGALEKIMGLAKGLRAECEREYKKDPENGVWKYIRNLEDTAPYMVALKGKCKADCYKTEKIEAFQMRFYNALGRQVILNMQVSTQVMESVSRNILDGSEYHSAQGVSLVRGGANDLVMGMDTQLMNEGVSYVHVGDDSWVAMLVEDGIVLFSLDCSNFDLTQHSEATARIHSALRTELERIDPVSGQVWYAFARERLVVTHGWATYKWKHAGPSGMAIQSKVNDVLMDVVLQRVTRLRSVAKDRESLNQALQEIGRGMHLDIRLEDYEFVPGRQTISDALRDVSFLFIGYRFYNENGDVMVFCDLPRSLSQMAFPGLKWVDDKRELAVTEAIRLGSTMMNMGLPPSELLPAYKQARDEVYSLIKRVIKENGDINDEKLKWAVQASPYSGGVIPSLSGTLRALEKVEELWSPGVELASTSEMVDALTLPRAFLSWAEEVEEVELERKKEHFVRPLARTVDPKLARIKRTLIQRRPKPTHPATLKNLGREPPTAVWGPDKQPRVSTEATVVRYERAKDYVGSRRDRSGYDPNADDISEVSEASDYDEYEERMLISRR